MLTQYTTRYVECGNNVFFKLPQLAVWCEGGPYTISETDAIVVAETAPKALWRRAPWQALARCSGRLGWFIK